MGKRETDSYMPVYILFTTVSGLLWLGLIVLKALDVVSMDWIAVLLGVWWIPLLILALAAIMVTAFYIKRTVGKWKVDQRIIRQAKAAGVWNKRPTPLGGRALELKAKKDFKIKRQPGETDAQLRRRCMAKADEEYANTPK